MLPIYKFTIGVRVAKLMLRTASRWGEVFDALGAKAAESLELSMPTNPTSVESARYRALIPAENTSVSFGASDVIVSHGSHSSGKTVKPETFLERFSELWSVINGELEITDVRRIGIVAEYREKTEQPSAHLVKCLSRLDLGRYHGGFHLAMERNLPLTDGAAPNPKRSDFVNVIAQVYDSRRDEEKDEAAFNANLDVQHYYEPLLKGGVADSAKALYRRHFEQEWRDYQKALANLGVVKKS